MHCSDDKEQHLLPAGIEQAKKAGLFLHSLRLKFKCVRVSTMTRARETAGIIMQSLDCKMEESDLLREIPICNEKIVSVY